MGGLPLIELYLMYGEVKKILDKAGVTVARCLVGNHITLASTWRDAPVTILKADDDMPRFWDALVNTAGLRWGSN
jgi:dihydroxyacetone kinase-like protein